HGRGVDRRPARHRHGERDAAVHALELEIVPRRQSHLGVDRAVDRGRARGAVGREPDRAVHRVGLGVGFEAPGADVAVHRAARDPHPGGHLARDLPLDVVVVGTHVPAVTGLALVFALAPGRRVLGADRHPALVLDHLDRDLVGVALAGALLRRHPDLGTRSGLDLDAAVDALDLNLLAGGDLAGPLEVVVRLA